MARQCVSKMGEEDFVYIFLRISKKDWCDNGGNRRLCRMAKLCVYIIRGVEGIQTVIVT